MQQLDFSEAPWDEAAGFALTKYPSYEIWKSRVEAGGHTRCRRKGTRRRKMQAGSAAEAAGRWTRAPSGGRGSSAAFFLPLPSPALDSHPKRRTRGRFPARLTFPAGVRSIPRGAALFLAPFPYDRHPASAARWLASVRRHSRLGDA